MIRLTRSLFLSIQASKKCPFFLVAAPHAPHAPYTPAPWYVNASVPAHNPELPSWNSSNVGKVPWLAMEPPLSEADRKTFNEDYANRARTLLSVDDVFVSLYNVLRDAGQLENTYFIHTSDHGYHLGEMRLPAGKTHAYDYDVRVPFAIRGPGIKPNSTANFMASNVDLAPTFFELAGIEKPAQMDGYSFAPLLLRPNSTATTRDTLLIDYYSIAPPPANYTPGETRINDCPNNSYRSLRLLKPGILSSLSFGLGYELRAKS